MKTIKETLELALEAMENMSTALREDDVHGGDIDMLLDAITALREALTSVPDWASEAIEQPAPVAKPHEQEPVATVTSETGVDIGMSWWHEPALPIGTKLYTSPPTLSLAQRQARSADTWVNAATWRGLTDEERDAIIGATDLSGTYYYDDLYAVILLAEGKLKEKNSD